MSNPSFDRCDRELINKSVDLSMQQIADDPALAGCSSFEELHSHCDANCLGGMCADDHPVWNDPRYYVNSEEGMTDLGWRVAVEIQDQTDKRIKEGKALT